MRARNDVAAAQKFALQGFAKQLLDVVDNLRRGLEVAENVKAPTPELQALAEGVAMTEKLFLSTLEKQGIKKMTTKVGDKLDANLHNVVFQVDDPNKPPGCIATVLKEGYTLHERNIRPAEVGTVRAPPAQAPPAAATTKAAADAKP